MIRYKRDRDKLNEIFGGTKDIMFLDFEISGKSAFLVFVDGLSDKNLFDRNIIEPLKAVEGLDEITTDTINEIIFITDPIIVAKDIDDLSDKICDGDIGLVIDGATEYMVLSMRNYIMRSIQEPPMSVNIKGPREGFIEDMKINMTMIRRRLRTPELRFDMFKVGQYTKTSISVVYINGVADDEIVKEIENRIQEIDIDGIIDSSYIARYIEDNRSSLFSQVGTAEKPDIVAAKLLEGRVAIVVDGSPIVLTLPFILFEHFQASEDYYIKPYRATVTRMLRLFAIMIAIMLPAVYVALQEFQYQLLPLKLLIVIMNSIHGVPLTPTLEMLSLLIIFEILNEASLRMPKYVGTAISIVGAIVLGETAVNAGLLSIPSVLVTAISTIGMYSVPDEVEAGSILRIGFVIIAGLLGMFGLILSFIVLTTYLVGLKSYKSSYMTPFAPLLPSDLKDTIVKCNQTEMNKRPYSVSTNNRTRSKSPDKDDK